MGTHIKTWSCCGDTSETDSWEPTECPFCPTPPGDVRELVKKLRDFADKHWIFALLVSNMGNPAADNDEGREATALRAAADMLEKLSSRTETLKCTDEKTTSSTPPATPPAGANI